jgi:hypothetical protein
LSRRDGQDGGLAKVRENCPMGLCMTTLITPEYLLPYATPEVNDFRQKFSGSRAVVVA